MWVDPEEPYHPYAACLMFKGCKDGNVVQANLDAVRAFGAQYDSGFDDLADRYAALEARCRQMDAVVRTVASLDLGPKGYCSGNLLKLKECAVAALASETD